MSQTNTPGMVQPQSVKHRRLSPRFAQRVQAVVIVDELRCITPETWAKFDKLFPAGDQTWFSATWGNDPDAVQV
jgi:hypothetical protein